METIKLFLLKNLQDVREVIDYNYENTQRIEIESGYTDVYSGLKYSLVVELSVKMTERYEVGNYDALYGQHEGSGVYYEPFEYTVENIYLTNDNGDDVGFIISIQDINDYVKV
jgi:hypothetical protein